MKLYLTGVTCLCCSNGFMWSLQSCELSVAEMADEPENPKSTRPSDTSEKDVEDENKSKKLTSVKSKEQRSIASFFKKT